MKRFKKSALVLGTAVAMAGAVAAGPATAGCTGGGSGTSLSGDPLPIVGGVDPGGITSGPNFEAGRRTWIDILPE